MVSRVCRHIHDSSKDQEGPPSLARLAQTAGVSPGRLHRVFKDLMGVTPRQYADACRLDSFKDRLKEGWNVAGAMYQAGYGSSSRLYQGAAAGLGMMPASYRRGGRGARITHNIVDSPLGRLLVAVTEHGVCAVKLGDSDAQLESSLYDEFPAAQFQGDDGTLLEWTQAIITHLRRLQGGPRNRAPGLELPLDIRATAFQRQVWEHLRSIPHGETRSYQEVAAALGKPRAGRAVGRACAANPVALVIPCHRVVRQDGGMGGYRWGISRKEQLLARERY
ncbi:MAG: methylated-DNA--[protein]-cysteine S-methyltransferase [Chloroflexi bacterium]|nr:methylated-DNA--[protein]-cysteine S-methyltransferase [Chloroflexota bacterium]